MPVIMTESRKFLRPALEATYGFEEVTAIFLQQWRVQMK